MSDDKTQKSNVMPLRVMANRTGYYIKQNVLAQLVVSLHGSVLDSSQDADEYAQLRDGYADQLTRNMGVLGAVGMVVSMPNTTEEAKLSVIQWLTNSYKDCQ